MRDWLAPGRAGWRADLAAAGLGALSALALPPLHLLPVLLLAVPGLLRLAGPQPGFRRLFRLGWWFGFGHHLLGLYWITEAILIEAARFWWLVPLAVPALAAYMALFMAAAWGMAALAAPGWRRGAMLAGAWVLADIARQFALSGFPWNPWGSAWAIPGLAGDIALQPAALIGVHGLSLVTVWLAALPASARAPGGRGAVLASAALVLAWLGYAALRLAAPAPQGTGVAVALIQGNVDQRERLDNVRAAAVFRRYLDLTRAAALQADAATLAVIWPESASPFWLEEDPDARRAIALAGTAVPGRRVLTLAGTVRGGTDRRIRNSLLVIDALAEPRGVYDKWHLVPFGEYDPPWSPLPIQIVPGGGFTPGPGLRTLAPPGLPAFGPLICYEVIFPGEILDRAARPAWLVNVTNDAWFGNSTGPRQHLAAARLRAVEERLPLFRAANTGISAAYDARGRELGRIALNQEGILVRALPGAQAPELFARFGLAVPALLAGVALLLGVATPQRKI